MSRPLRIGFPGAVHHITSRDDRREPIYRNDADRLAHLDVLAQAMDRFDASVLADCLMQARARGSGSSLAFCQTLAALNAMSRPLRAWGQVLPFAKPPATLNRHVPPPPHRIPRRHVPRHLAR